MESWNHPAFRPSEGTTMNGVTRRDQRNLSTNSDLLTRTSWVDAKTAYNSVKKGKAFGNTCALWVRWHIQKHLYNLGCFIQSHCGKVLFLGILLLSLCCVGLKTARLETNVEKLWVEEGGRLEKELQYTKSILGEGSGITNEIVIQTPKSGSNVLTVESMLLHLKALQVATDVEVDMYGINWKLSDICYKTSFPRFEEHVMERLLEDILPCVIISPLDCFWEGSKLLGPVHPLHIPGIPVSLKWSNLNPVHLIEMLKNLNYHFAYEAIQDLLKRAGISTGYQQKPCLNPHDPECPFTAANFQNKQIPDVGTEVTGGCTGFSAKFMKWEEDLIVGGVQKNKSGYIVRAEALQSILQLMGSKNMYEYYQEHNRVLSIDWNQEKATEILEAWQRKFTQEVNKLAKNETKQDSVLSFSGTSLLDILSQFSEVSSVRVALGYVLMLIYSCISLLRWSDAVQSQSGVGIAGVMLVALSVTAGLGICSVFGLTFNASTTQIIPFLALGIGVDDMFLIAHAFAENSNKPEIPYMEQTGEVLKRTGVSVLLTSISNICAFFTAAIIPIPALRAFTLQAGILVIFNLASILLVFPAIVSLDLIRREERKVDVFCCFTGPNTNQVVELQPREGTPPPEYQESSHTVTPGGGSYNVTMHQVITQTQPDGSHPVTMLAPPDYEAYPYRAFGINQVCPGSVSTSASSSRQCLTPEEGMSCRQRCVQTQRECCSWSLTWLASRIYGPLLSKTPVKILILVVFGIMLGFGVYGTIQVKDGLDLTDIVPRHTNEYKFLDVQSKYFGFYNFYAVTKADFDYPNNQELLYEYHKSFQRVKKIIKKEDGSLPSFWLELFRQWLQDLQQHFDRDFSRGFINKDGWNKSASDEGVLAYKLLLQTGDIDQPTDKDSVLTRRLVDKNGIIYHKAFYNYLTAWTSNDAFAYASSQANFQPIPREWIHAKDEMDLKIPKSQPLTYAQLPFYLNDMTDTVEITDTIRKVRGICEKFENENLPNYPSGIPFTFWEQYINLRYYLMLSLLCILGAIFLVLTVVLLNPWSAIVVVFVLAVMVVELFGFMGLVGIKLSAVPAVILIVSVGIGVEFTVHVCMGFITSIGSRNRRMKMTLEHVFAPVIHGAMSTLLGVIMLVGSEFDFIVKYFFVVLTALVILGILNGLVLLPVLLSIFGPNGEVVPKDNLDHLPPPTPEPSPPPPERHVHSISRRVYPRIPSDISLTTITEEPTQYSSHEIVVQPEVVVETTTIPGATSIVTSNNSSSKSSPASSSTSTPAARHVTTVTATTKVKVEVHTPLPGTVEQERSYKSKRRKLKEVENSDSDSSNKS